MAHIGFRVWGTLGLYRDHGEENGNFFSITGLILG